MTLPLSLVLPVGPERHHCRYLGECLASIQAQSVRPADVLIIDDWHAIQDHCDSDIKARLADLDARVWCPPWRLGNPAAVNCGVGLAAYDPVLVMAGDDQLLPGAIEAAWRAYESYQRQPILYYFGIRYSDGREDQQTICGCALVTKELWKMTGGYSPRMIAGDHDAALGSILLHHLPDHQVPIDPHRPYYWYRVHDESDTETRHRFDAVAGAIRELVTDDWQRPTWNALTARARNCPQCDYYDQQAQHLKVAHGH